MAGNIGSRKLYLLLLGVVVVGLIGLGKFYMQSPPAAAAIVITNNVETRGHKPEVVSKIAVQKPITSSNSAERMSKILSNSSEKKPDSSSNKTKTQNADAKNFPEKLKNSDSNIEVQVNRPTSQPVPTQRPETENQLALQTVLPRLSESQGEPSGKLRVVYRDLSTCEKPQYLPEYQGHCWGRCKHAQNCSEPATHQDIKEDRARLTCFEDFYMIGVRKCGTTDISSWFLRLNHIYGNRKGQPGGLERGDYYPDEKCPAEFFAATFPNKTLISTQDRLYHYGPGNLLASKVYQRNSTHMVVSPTSQFLGFMATPKSRFHIQLRHPTDRAISYMYHWHKGGLIFADVSYEKFSNDLTDYLLLGVLKELEDCIRDLGELGCLYQTNGRDGVLASLLKHSLYVVYIEEAFKFIPQDQFVFTTMEEYSKSEPTVMKNVLEAFGIDYHVNPYLNNQAVNVLNKGKKKPVADQVIKAMDDFFMPYNRRLAKLLHDDKFLYLRS